MYSPFTGDNHTREHQNSAIGYKQLVMTMESSSISKFGRKQTNIFFVEEDDVELQHLNEILEKEFKITYRKNIKQAKSYLSNPDKPIPDLICVNMDTNYENREDLIIWIKQQSNLRNIPVFLLSNEVLNTKNFIKTPYSSDIKFKLLNATKVKAV